MAFPLLVPFQARVHRGEPLSRQPSHSSHWCRNCCAAAGVVYIYTHRTYISAKSICNHIGGAMPSCSPTAARARSSRNKGSIVSGDEVNLEKKSLSKIQEQGFHRHHGRWQGGLGSHQTLCRSDQVPQVFLRGWVAPRLEVQIPTLRQTTWPLEGQLQDNRLQEMALEMGIQPSSSQISDDSEKTNRK